MGAVLGYLFDFDDPLLISTRLLKDTDYIPPDDVSLGDNDLYRDIKDVYDMAAAETRKKAELEAANPMTDEEIQNIIQRTSIHSITTPYVSKTKQNKPGCAQAEEYAITPDLFAEIPLSLKEEDGNYSFHLINPNETLEGIALHYSVRVSELRTINSIRNNQDFYSKETILIPMKQRKLSKIKGETLTPEQELAVSSFTKQMNCDRELALPLLRKFGYHSPKAISAYLLQKLKEGDHQEPYYLHIMSNKST